MIVGIILAAGKGTRMKSKDKNKVTIPFLSKPLIVYSVELMKQLADRVIVVIGAFHESVKKALSDFKVDFAYQKKRLGTGHATMIGIKKVIQLGLKPDVVLVGYGDHTMFYKKESIKKLIEIHKKKKSAVSLITTIYKKPEKLKWGRIIRDKTNQIVKIIEEKDATPKEKRITELNAGFYCFDFDFLKNNLKKIKKSPVSKEYYINDLINLAHNQNKRISSLTLDFLEVGIGINNPYELEESEKLYLKRQG